MSGQTIVGNALQFTDDNKHAYANSGVITVASASSANTIALKFQTANSYLVGTLAVQSDENAGNLLYTTVTFDGTTVFAWKWDLSASSLATIWPQPLLIPPNTDVEIKVGAGDTVEFTVQLIAKVGMPQRVGN